MATNKKHFTDIIQIACEERTVLNVNIDFQLTPEHYKS